VKGEVMKGMNKLFDKLAGGHFSRRRPRPPLRTYFSLEIQSGQQQSEMESERLYAIEENKNYKVVVKAYVGSTYDKSFWDNHWREACSQHWQEEQWIQTDGTLVLQCYRGSDRGSMCSCIEIEDNNRPVLYNALEHNGFSCTFNITAIGERETEELIFKLYYQPDALGLGRLMVAELRVILQGSYYPADSGLFKEAAISRDVLQSRLPEDTCIIYLTSENEESDEDDTTKTVLQCWSRICQPLPRKTIARTPINMSEFNEEKEKELANLIVDLSEYSAGGALVLKNWLAEQWQQLASQQKRLHVIIVDYNLYPTPWEALELDHRVYLGAEALVVRWLPVPSFGESDYRYYDTNTLKEFVAGERTETVLAYLDAEETNLEEINLELGSLRQINATLFADVADFKKRLLASLQGVCFVYIGAHGDEGNAFGSKKPEETRITRQDLGYKEPEDGPRPLFFLNTCHSAILQAKQGLNKVGLLSVILRRMAAGYIGTMGAVGRPLARKIGHDFIMQALRPEGVLIPEFLRDLRAQIASKVRDESYNQLPVKQRILVNKEFFYTFMYVYYGNLHARLHLHPGKREVEEVDRATGAV
jgi:hypothetical protein